MILLLLYPSISHTPTHTCTYMHPHAHTSAEGFAVYHVGSCEKVSEESNIMKVEFKRIILASVQNGLEAGVRQEDLQGSYYNNTS